MSREFPKNPEPQNIALPTVGRIVLFQSQERAPALPAIVVAVVDGCLKINVLNVFSSMGVEVENYIDHASEVTGENKPRWDWMDYQKGQAAKAEQLEAQLKSSFGGAAGGMSGTSGGNEMGKLQAGAPSPVDGKR